MVKSEAKSELEEFKSHPARFQITFETPLKELRPFVDAILRAGGSPDTASAIIDSYVFEPKVLKRLVAKHSIHTTFERGVCLNASGASEVVVLLRAMLNEWIDFLFLPRPRSFAIYADHDEFTTLYASTQAVLDRMSDALLERGFKLEAKFVRTF